MTQLTEASEVAWTEPDMATLVPETSDTLTGTETDILPVEGVEITLEEVRDAIDLCDQSIITLVAKRMELAKQAGAIKEREGLPRRNLGRENVVRERMRQHAVDRGITDRTLVVDIWTALTTAANRAQSQRPVGKAAVEAVTEA